MIINLHKQALKLKFVYLIFGIWGCKIIQLFMHKCHKIAVIMHAMSMINLLNPIIEKRPCHKSTDIKSMHFMHVQLNL